MNEIRVKLIVLGPSFVGKTTFLTKIKDKEFAEAPEPTVGANFFSHVVTRDDKVIKYEMWDTAGQEAYRSLNKMYYSNTGVAVCIYDITSMKSFELMKTYLDEFLAEEGSSHPVVFIVGNKSDLEPNREVQTGFAKDYAEGHKWCFGEMSVKNDVGVNELIEHITDMVVENIETISKRNDSCNVLDMEQVNAKNTEGKKCC